MQNQIRSKIMSFKMTASLSECSRWNRTRTCAWYIAHW